MNTYLPDFNTADAVKLGEVELNAAGIPEAAAGVGLALALASAITRVMALAVVENLLPAWLRPAPNADDELLALDRKNGAVCDQARAAARLGNSRS
ncbi:hypothetical protein [Streptomyces anandii]|uniref:Uncharacterized protein n=1 Tax=Streptomyces anandii TaxID=285454 RepID=A0ABW6H395_9ACTN